MEQDHHHRFRSSLRLWAPRMCRGRWSATGEARRLLLTDYAQSQVLSGEPNHWRGESEFEKASGETLVF